MRFSLLFLLALPTPLLPADVDFAPLRLYAGSWHVTRSGQATGGKPDEQKNECAQIGRFYACQQSVNGSPGGLLIFVPGDSPTHFHTQNVLPTGRATGLGEVEINGSKWTFLSTWNQGSKTTRYRNTYLFSGRDRMHFEQEESDDGVHWKTAGSGDEVRIGR